MDLQSGRGEDSNAYSFTEYLSRFDAKLWHMAQSGENVSLPALMSQNGLGRSQLTIEVVISDSSDPVNLFTAAKAKGVTLYAEGANLLAVLDEDPPFVLGFWPSGREGVYFLGSTVPFTDRRWKRVERWVGAAAPSITPFFLNHDDFTRIGSALSHHYDVEVSRVTARDLSDWSSHNRGWPVRNGAERPTYSSVIRQMEAIGASVRTMSLQVRPHMLSMHLRRLAGATYYSGDFNLFQSVVLRSLARAAQKRRELLIDRSRRVGAPDPGPIRILLSRATFASTEATEDLLEELGKISDVGLAVMHRNPYLHVVVTDYRDGSNFDVFVTDTDSVDIYPGYKASRGALTRLTDAISERFLATEVDEASRREPISLDDLVSAG